jgi:hypothetical protein
MLQYLYNETGAAAQEIVEKVAPEVNAVSKEEVKEAATERAKEIAADVAKADETVTQEQHSAIVEACSQVIYAQVCGDLARIQAEDNLVSLFSEEKKAKRKRNWKRAGTVAGETAGGALAGAGAAALIGLTGHALSGKSAARDQAAIQGHRYGTPEWREAYRKIRAQRRNKILKKAAIVGAGAGTLVGAGDGIRKAKNIQ